MKKENDEKSELDIWLDGWVEGNINSSVNKKLEISRLMKSLEQAKDKVNNDIKLYLKERKWTKYFDKETKISVDLSVITKEDLDRKKLKLLLSPTQYNSIIKISTYEKLSVLTVEDRDKLKKFIRKNI